MDIKNGLDLDYDRLYETISLWEDKGRKEREIIQRCIMLVERASDEEEMLYNLNNVLMHKGYSYQFKLPASKKEIYNHDKYVTLVQNVSKSALKTQELIKYLSFVKSYRLTISSMHLLKIKQLVNLNVLDGNIDIIKNNMDSNLYDFYFGNYENKDARAIVDNLFDSIGLIDQDINYMRFRLDMEWLIWSISLNDKSKDTYIKQNTIRVAFNICPRDYYEWNDKKYYNPKIMSCISSYLKLIDKSIRNKMIDKYSSYSMEFDNTGYKLLFNML